MATRFAWVLNLDADVELAAIASGAPGARNGYTPGLALVRATQMYAPRLAQALVDESLDVVVDGDSPPLVAAGFVGRAFCPTPRALRLLRRAGAEPEPSPECDVLVRVNGRAFAASLGTTLPGASFVGSEDEARATLATAPPEALGRMWRVKRNHGMTGRGQRRVNPSGITPGDLAFVRAGLLEGGVQIEPDVALVTEYATHGLLCPDGGLVLGPPVRQHCDARGAWVRSERIQDGSAPAELRVETERVAGALRAAGYFGPFGVDAFTYRVEGGGGVDLQPRSEINARYTMGFAVVAHELLGRRSR